MDRGLSQSKIADSLGASRSHISRVKSGEHEFTDEQLETIERVIAVPLAVVLLVASPAPGAPAALRRLHQEARLLLEKSALTRGKLEPMQH